MPQVDTSSEEQLRALSEQIQELSGQLEQLAGRVERVEKWIAAVRMLAYPLAGCTVGVFSWFAQPLFRDGPARWGALAVLAVLGLATAGFAVRCGQGRPGDRWLRFQARTIALWLGFIVARQVLYSAGHGNVPADWDGMAAAGICVWLGCALLVGISAARPAPLPAETPAPSHIPGQSPPSSF